MDERTRVLARLREMLTSGEFPERSRLPPERTLARTLGTTRHDLRRALGALEAEGRIWRHVGRGTFVGSTPLEPAPSGAWPLGKLTNPGEVMELRLILEPRIAALAAMRATAADLDRVEQCLHKGSARVDRASFETWDSALHAAIADAAHNTLLRSVFQAVNTVRNEKLWGKLKEASLTAARQDLYVRQHRACVVAIHNRDAALAEASMREHIETVRANMLGSP